MQNIYFVTHIWEIYNLIDEKGPKRRSNWRAKKTKLTIFWSIMRSKCSNFINRLHGWMDKYSNAKHILCKSYFGNIQPYWGKKGQIEGQNTKLTIFWSVMRSKCFNFINRLHGWVDKYNNSKHILWKPYLGNIQ